MEHIDNNQILSSIGINYTNVKNEEVQEEEPVQQIIENSNNFEHFDNINKEEKNVFKTLFSKENIKIFIYSLILFFIFGQDFFFFSSLPVMLSILIRGLLMSISLVVLYIFL